MGAGGRHRRHPERPDAGVLGAQQLLDWWGAGLAVVGTLMDLLMHRMWVQRKEVGDTGWGRRSGGQSGPECERPLGRPGGICQDQVGTMPQAGLHMLGPPNPSTEPAPQRLLPQPLIVTGESEHYSLVGGGVGTGANAFLTGASQRRTLSAFA